VHLGNHTDTLRRFPLGCAQRRPAHSRRQCASDSIRRSAFVPSDSNWPVGIAVLIAACAVVGDGERASRRYETLVPYGEFHVIAGTPAISVGSAEAFLARAAGTAGRWEAADEHFAREVEANEKSGNRPWLVHTKHEYAKLLARRGDADDRPRLRELLSDCLAGATDMGMTRVVEQTQALADSAGITLE
jgi:hypothetical protein